MSIGINNSMNQYAAMNSGRSSSVNTRFFDYAGAQKEAQEMIANYKSSTASVSKLQNASADFLKKYTNGMTEQKTVADKVMGPNLDKILYDKDGKVTDETVKKTTEAVQAMVDQHNANLKMLNDNADRGSGVVNQIGRMVDNPAAAASMDMVGVKVNKDGTLALDTEKLAKNLKTEDKNQLKLYKDIIGGSNGIAAGVKKDGEAGLRASAGSLIANDLAKMQELKSENSFDAMSLYSRSGAYGFNNMAAVGMLMNMMA